MTDQKATVVIPTRNRVRDLNRCLNALAKQTVPDFEILVVDNGSSEKTSEVMLKHHVRFVRLHTGNLTQVFNVGWKSSKNEIIAYLNDDSEPTAEWLEEALSSLADPTIDCVGGPTIDLRPRDIARFLYYNNKTIPRFLRSLFETLILGRSIADIGYFSPVGAYSIGIWLPNSVKIGALKDVDFVTITNMAIRKASLEKLEGFDENFFYNHADSDLCVRMKRVKSRIVFDPKMTVWHHVNPSGRVRLPFYLGRDFAYFLSKDFVPKSFNNLLKMTLYISTLAIFWIFKAGTTGSLEPLKGIVGLISGFRYALKAKLADDFQK